MKVSICIPSLCRTNARFDQLAECVGSALGQSHQNLEVIVVDNASPIDVETHLHRLFQDPRLFISRNPRTLPMPANFNMALSLSTGEILKPLCDDDLIHPDVIAGCIEPLKVHPFLRIRDVLFTKTSEIQWQSKYESKVRTTHTWRQKFEIVDAIAPTCTIFRRLVWEEVGPYSEEVDHVWDYIFALEAQLKFGFALSETVGCAFRRWAESSTYCNRDALTNYKEMHVLYRRNKTFSLTVAKYLYLLRQFAWVCRRPSLLPEWLRFAPRYL